MEERGANNSYMVCIRCVTYNHKSYIEDAMNGFVAQNTDFPYECIIVDDASTDGNQATIKKYFDTNFSNIETEETNDYILYFGNHKTNQYCNFVIINLKYNHYSIKKNKNPYFKRWQDLSKYVAFCEGDDYWTDSSKLQTQVSFLEEHDDFGLCYTKCRQYIQKDKTFLNEDFGQPTNGFEDMLINGNRIPTLTTCMRLSILDKYFDEIKPSERGWLMGDYPIWLYFAHETKIKFIDISSGVYRILENSASHNIDINKTLVFHKSFYEIKAYFAQRYSVEYDYNTDLKLYPFYIYLELMFQKYNRDTAQKMRSSYKKAEIRRMNYTFYCMFSHWKFSWQIMKLSINLFNKVFKCRNQK